MLPYQVIQLWQDTKHKETFKQKLSECGFKLIGCGERSVVFSKKGLDYVVKVSNGLVTRPFKELDLEKFRLPYIYVNGNRQIGIQLKATRRTTKSRYKAWVKIRDSVDIPLATYDIHQDNVGWIDRKPVIFDYV